MSWFINLRLSDKLSFLSLVIAFVALIYTIISVYSPKSNTLGKDVSISGNGSAFIEDNNGSIHIEK